MSDYMHAEKQDLKQHFLILLTIHLMFCYVSLINTLQCQHNRTKVFSAKYFHKIAAQHSAT